MTIIYAEEPELGLEDFIDILRRSGFEGRRPLEDGTRMRTVLAGADIIMTARDSTAEGALIGVARCLTDTALVCYCAELAVDTGYHGRGVGQELLAAARRQLHPECHFHVIAAPQDEAFAAQIGLVKLERAYEWPQA